MSIQTILLALRQAICFHSQRATHWVQAEDHEGPGRNEVCDGCGKVVMRERAA